MTSRKIIRPMNGIQAFERNVRGRSSRFAGATQAGMSAATPVETAASERTRNCVNSGVPATLRPMIMPDM